MRSGWPAPLIFVVMIQLKASAGMLNSMGTDFWSEPEKCAAEARPGNNP